MTTQWIDSDPSVRELTRVLADHSRFALDTEFHRERTYFPKLALIQVAWADGSAIIDPLSCDVSPLTELFSERYEVVLHAAQQDLDVLFHAIGVVPARIFDTQIAAGFLGYSTPSLASLVNSELKISLPKGDRLTDWLRRPLTEAQKTYALSDVEYLLELQDRLSDELDRRRRLQWAFDACEELRCRRVGPADPTEVWRKQKDVRGMRPRTRGVLAALAEWRERRAMDSDIPPRQVLPDLALHGIAQREPSSVSELAQARGVDERHTRGTIAQEILRAVEVGKKNPLELPQSEGDEMERHLRPAVTLLSAWVSEVARMEHIDAALLATRQDIVDFLRGERGGRLSTGWRQELLGTQLDDLLKGRAGLSFDGRGGLKMIRADVQGD
ncbi:MAG: ribonuclease D [Actinomycetota bacterium]